MNDDIRSAGAVVRNVSRTIIGAAKNRYEFPGVVQVTAPAQLLAARLPTRQREGDGKFDGRMARAASGADVTADVVLS